jgi:DNA-binding winged helix-turn-helix (wHTH) protein/tetratricopeptide (TPR) repeat protein
MARQAHDIVVDGWRVDEAGHRLVRKGEERRLEPRAMQVLLVLARDPGAVVTRRDLIIDVWGDSFVSDDALSAAIIRLRRAFGDPARAPRVIETVAKSGYRLRADVGPAADAPSSLGAVDEPAVRVATLVHVLFDVIEPGDDPERWLRCRGQVAAVVAVEAERHGGWSVVESSDVVAVFGAPRAREDHQARAVRCALAVVAARLRVRCGVAAGELMAGGPEVIAGTPVQLARELATRADVGSVLVTPETGVAIDPDATEPVADFWRVVAPPADLSTWDARRRRGLTPLMGRAPDLAALDALADRAERGFGQVVVLVGDAGIGKSRLVHELRAIVEARGWHTAMGAASSVDRHSPYVAVRRLLMDAGARPAADTPAWNAVMRPDQTDPDWQALDPMVRQQRITEATAGPLLAEDRAHALVVEDVQWADEASRAWLSQVVNAIARRRCLLLLTTRPPGDERWSDRSYGTRVRVGPLFPADAAALLDSLTGDSPGLTSWKGEVLELAAGTPLFLEECVRAVLSSRVGTTPSEFDGAMSRAIVPSSVRTLLAERVDALSPDARAIIVRAAVGGPVTPQAVLRDLVDIGDGAFLDALSEIARSEILRPVPSETGPAWEFGHALLHESAYAGIPGDTRRSIHLAVAKRLGREPGAVTAARVARHMTEAGLIEPALDAWLRATRTATEADAYHDALVHLERARALVAHVADETTRDRYRLRIALATGTSAVQAHGPTAASTRQAFDEAGQLADRVGTANQRFEARWGAWFVVLHSGDMQLAAQLADSLAALVPELHDPSLVLETHHAQWSGMLVLGRTEEALAHARAGIQIYRPDEHHRLTYSFGGHDPGVCARNIAALSLWLLGDREASRQHSADAVALARSLGHPYSQVEACYTVLTVAAVEGDLADLASHLATLDGLSEQNLLPDSVCGYADGLRGALERWEGNDDDALRLLKPAAPVWRQFWGTWCLPLDTVLAATLLRAGRTADALDVLDAAQQLSTSSRTPWWDAEILRVRAVANQGRWSADDVVSLLQQATDAARRTGAVSLEQRVRDTADELLERAATAAEPRTLGARPRRPRRAR